VVEEVRVGLITSERELARRHWQFFGKPFVIAFGIAALIGLGLGVVWVIAGLLNFHVFR
jgi:hypothetical protein